MGKTQFRTFKINIASFLGFRLHVNAGGHRRPVDERTREVVKSYLGVEYDFYHWIKKRFYDQRKLMNFEGHKLWQL